MKTKILFKKESLVGHKSSRLFLFGIMFLAIALALMLPKSVNAATILVPDDYPTIQQAVNSAVTGDMVYVRAGTYYEHVTITKSITLQGEDKETTIIDGGGSGQVIYITANYVTISGLSAANGEAGIKLIPNYSINHVTIKDVIITLNYIGLHAIHNGGYHLIENCIISDNNAVSYAHQFHNCIIRNNEIFGNQNGLNVGWGYYTLITNNNVHHNNGTGIHFDSMFNSIIENNNIHNNGCGVEVGYVGRNNTIRDNIIYQNSVGVRFHEANVRNNRVYHNDFRDNTVQAQDDYSTNIWDNGYPSGGNYYSDYTGVDLNHDGIGDTPYVFANNRDNYPLMQPQNNLPPVAMCQNVIVSANENCEAIVTPAQVDDSSYDPDGDPITLSLDPTGPYQLGETTVTLTVEDDSGDTDQCTATITVLDDTAPVITTIADPINLWPPNHRYATFNLSDFVLSVSDNCSVLLIDDIVISKVTSDEPEDANGGGDGKTTDDMIISNDCKSIQLRKERQGNGNGRVYTVYLELNDANSNTGSGTCQVQVPHNNGQTAIDDGAVYEVFGDCDNKSSFIVENNKSENKINLINYPNPFNRSTTLVFSLEKANKTTLKVYNSLGQEVVVLFDGYAEADQIYELTFKGDGLPEGLYFCHMQSGDLHFTNRLLLAR